MYIGELGIGPYIASEGLLPYMCNSTVSAEFGRMWGIPQLSVLIANESHYQQATAVTVYLYYYSVAVWGRNLRFWWGISLDTRKGPRSLLACQYWTCDNLFICSVQLGLWACVVYALERARMASKGRKWIGGVRVAVEAERLRKAGIDRANARGVPCEVYYDPTIDGYSTTVWGRLQFRRRRLRRYCNWVWVLSHPVWY